MSPGVPTKLTAASCGMTAFAVAIVAGLSAGNPTDVVLSRAIVSMVACQIVGFAIGAVGERTVREAVRGYQQARPVGKGTGGNAQPGTRGSAEDGEEILVV